MQRYNGTEEKPEHRARISLSTFLQSFTAENTNRSTHHKQEQMYSL